MKTLILLFVTCSTVLFACTVSASDDTDVADLKRQISDLETRLGLAEKSAELLEKEIELLRKENAQLKGEERTSQAEEIDQFRVGVVWVGEARTGGRIAQWAVSVSERSERRFSGVVAIVAPDGKKSEFPVSGTAPATGNGLLVLESPLVGRAKLYMRGRVANGEAALAFSGTTRLGDKILGSATLRPKN